VLVAGVAVGHYLASGRRWPTLLARLPSPVRGFGYAVAVSLALVLATEADKAFIYFQF
jgi:hypothetical protein